MKQTILSLLLLLLVSNLSFGQENNPRKYFDNINKAELAIIDSNYSKACKYYKKAFNYLAEPFGNDINNFLVCGLYTDDSVALQMCCPFFIRRSYYYSSYSDTYKEKRLSNYWLYLIESSNIKSEVDTNFVRFINTLLSKDYKSRSSEIVDGKVIMKDKSGYGIFDQDSLNMALLIDYIKINNIELNEKNVSSNENIYNRYYSTTQITGQILLIHYAQSAYRRQKPLSLDLRNKVILGEFNPQLYAHLVDYRGYGLDGLEANFQNDKYGVRTSLLMNEEGTLTLKYPQYNKKELRVINRNRKEIYLCKYKDFIKKLSYEKKRWDIIYSKKTMFRAEFIFCNPWSLALER